MKVAVSSQGQNIDSKVHTLFGRCDFFVVVDTETGSFESITNDSREAATGAGTACVQSLIKFGTEAVISSQVGPNAYEALKGAGIDVFISKPGLKVEEAIQELKAGTLSKMEIQKF